MIKKSQTYSKEFDWITIYKNDIVDIYDVLKKGQHDDVKIEIDDNTLEDIKELEEFKDREQLFKVNFTAYKPYITVDIDSSYRAKVYISDDSDPLLFGSAVKIENILTHQRNGLNSWLYGMKKQTILYMIFIVISTFSELIVLAEKITKDEITLIFFGNIAIAFLLFLLLDKIGKNKHCIIYPKDKAAVPGFFRRNKDNLIINSIFTAIGLAVGYMLGKK